LAFQPISQQKYFALLGRAFWKQHKFSGFKSYFRFLIVLVVVSKDDLFVFLYGLGALQSPLMDPMDLCTFWTNGICESLDSSNLNIPPI
jgi:hypothetical protein